MLIDNYSRLLKQLQLFQLQMSIKSKSMCSQQIFSIHRTYICKYRAFISTPKKKSFVFKYSKKACIIHIFNDMIMIVDEHNRKYNNSFTFGCDFFCEKNDCCLVFGTHRITNNISVYFDSTGLYSILY